MSYSDKAEELHAQLAAQIETLQSSEDWRAALDSAARFHSYSMGNALLIAFQGHARGFEPSFVAGFNRWKTLKRSVRKGERGLMILAPHRRKRTDAEGQEHFFVSGFGVTHVFDISQTDGEPLAAELLRPTLLDHPDDGAVWDTLSAYGTAEGLTIALGDTLPANGWYRSSDRRIEVEASNPQAQRTKTLAHELGHALLHNGEYDASQCRGEEEVEAESVAYIVMQALGFDTAGYSLPYIAGWGSRDPKAVEKTMSRVTKAARAILAVFDPKETPKEVAA